MRALSIKHVWERPGGRALRCPYRRDLATLPTPSKGRATYSCPRKAVRRDLESARAKVGVFLSESSFFPPWATGVFELKPATLLLPRTRQEATALTCSSELRPHPVEIRYINYSDRHYERCTSCRAIPNLFMGSGNLSRAPRPRPRCSYRNLEVRNQPGVSILSPYPFSFSCARKNNVSQLDTLPYFNGGSIITLPTWAFWRTMCI